MEHDCTTETVAGATLVAVRVRNTAPVPRRVRVRNELPGPVLPPRREGVPERGWDADGFEGVLDADEERALGYACPVVAEDDSPVSVTGLGRVGAETETDATAKTDRENEAIRALGRARPPADAVPVPDGLRGRESLAGDAGPAGESTEAAASGDARRAVHAEGVHADDRCGDGDASGRSVSGEPTDGRGAVSRPPAVASWLDAVETRVRVAERLTDATAADATAALETASDASDLPSAVDTDEAALRAVATRAAELADRAAETDAGPVVAALEAL